jgi:predicted RNase H-like nuclease (RuvC/YqgF family)
MKTIEIDPANLVIVDVDPVADNLAELHVKNDSPEAEDDIAAREIAELKQKIATLEADKAKVTQELLALKSAADESKKTIATLHQAQSNLWHQIHSSTNSAARAHSRLVGELGCLRNLAPSLSGPQVLTMMDAVVNITAISTDNNKQWESLRSK